MLLELVTIASIYGGADGLCNKPVADPAEKVLHCDKLVAAMCTMDGCFTSSPKIPFGTHIKVCRAGTNKCVVVSIHDRGPFRRNRNIDLSPAAGAAIGCDGLCTVTLDKLD